MNELIQKLYNQSWSRVDPTNPQVTFMNAFAESVVKECMEVGQQSITRGIGIAITEGSSMEITQQALPDYVKRKIKEHFGVRE